jgi:hypothetical protein
VPRTSLLFTLSIVTRAVRQGCAPEDSVAVFGNGLRMLKDWHASPMYPVFGEGDGEHGQHLTWLKSHPGLWKLLRSEMQWIKGHAEISFNVLRYFAQRRNWEYPLAKVPPAMVGCCNAAYPGLEEVRIAWVDVNRVGALAT